MGVGNNIDSENSISRNLCIIIAFEKDREWNAFEKIGGFYPVAEAISGDDMYLVQSISKHYDVQFNIDPKSFIYTEPVQSINRHHD